MRRDAISLYAGEVTDESIEGQQVEGRVPLLTILVMSDLHATSKPPGDEAGSWLTTTTPRNATEHPILGLRELLERNGIKPTLTLCAGDLADRADAGALVNVWADVAALAEARESVLIATAGNHDVDSRAGTEIDPRGVLFDLQPLFPHNEEGSRADYWSRNYCIVDGPDDEGEGAVAWRVVALNSSAFHGLSTEHGKELDHGRVSRRTTARLERDLSARRPSKVQILLVHHHVEQMPDVDTDEKGQLKEAEHLLALLEKTGPWLVVHGHKHRAYFQYARGGAGSAAIFSAASLSAYAWGQASSIASNQAHLITLADPVDAGVPSLAFAATFKSWSWRPGVGWTAAESSGGWPGEGGFGWRIDPAALARMIRASGVGPTEAVTSEMLISSFPEMPYLSPNDTQHLARQLENANISVSMNSAGEIIELRAKMALVEDGV